MAYGELFVTPTPLFRHQHVVSNLFGLVVQGVEGLRLHPGVPDGEHRDFIRGHSIYDPVTFEGDLVEIPPTAGAPHWPLKGELGQELDALGKAFHEVFGGQRAVTCDVLENLEDLAACVWRPRDPHTAGRDFTSSRNPAMTWSCEIPLPSASSRSDRLTSRRVSSSSIRAS